MAVIGGISSIPGALLGAFYLLGTEWFLPTDWQFLATGFGVLLVLLILPSGLGGSSSDPRPVAAVGRQAPRHRRAEHGGRRRRADRQAPSRRSPSERAVDPDRPNPAPGGRPGG